MLLDPNAEGPLVNPPACDCLPLQGPRHPRPNRGPYHGKGPLQQEGKEYGKRVKTFYNAMAWPYICLQESEMESDRKRAARTLSDCLKQYNSKAWQAAAKYAEKLANDPPDEEYQRLVGAGSDSFAGYMEALTASMERYQAAKAAEDRNWTAEHVAALRLYFKRLAGTLRRDAEALQKNGEQQAPENANTQALREAARQQLFERLRRNGLTREDLQALRDGGIDEVTARTTMYRVLAHPQQTIAGKSFEEDVGFTDIIPLPSRSPRAMLLDFAEENRKWAADAERIATLPTDSEYRIGLLEALEHRASFTRAHRGASAAQLEGNTFDSSDFAATWRAAEHTYCAWHQDKDQVIFAGFDSGGKVSFEPRVMGNGRYPRIVADGDRVALGWSGPEGNNFVVRLNDGKQWGGEIQVTGREAAFVFAPGGPLYAATSTGLWKLNGNHFDRIQEANYFQPAIAADKEGKTHVAWRQNGLVLYDGNAIGEGDRPSVVITPDGTANLAYLAKGALVVRSEKAGQWTPDEAIPAKSPSWPTLALDSNGGLRLTYIGAADYGPDALWLIRLPDEQPILMPSLAGNVTDAWFTVKFDLEDQRNNYRPHDVLLTVNDVWVQMFQNTVPDGRYLFQLNPYQIFTSSGQPVPNRVAMHTWHMNPGHYATDSNYQLIVRTPWSEHYAFAANEEEARRGVGTYGVNHDQPDLGIFANATNLSVEQPKPGRMDVPVLIANLGEATSSATRLLMLGEKQTVLGTAQVPPLKPGADKTITMPFDYDGKLAQLSFRLENNHDFDPSNDSLTLTLWGPGPTGYVGPEPGLPKGPLELKVNIANEPQPPAHYQIVDAFSKRMIAKVVNGEQFGPLRSGTYRIAVQQYPHEGQEVLFTDNIQHQAGVPQTVQLNSGIKIDLSESAGNISKWSAVEPGNPDRVIQWQSREHPLMALPPGEYQVAVKPDEYYSERLVWPQKIQVQPDQVVTLKLASGIRIEVPQEVGGVARWEVMKSGKPEQVLQWHRSDRLVTPLPPGEYQVAVKPDEYYSERLVWPQKIVVQPDQVVALKLSSGVRIEVPQEVGGIARWEVMKFGKPDQVLQWHRNDRLVTPLPPGEYQLALKPDEYYSQRLAWPQKIVVQPDQVVALKLSSGVRIEVPQEVGGIARWDVVKFGKPDQVLQWHRNDRLVTPLPPGEYQLALKPDE